MRSSNINIDILIIGGGITGSSTAILLQRKGYSTVIIEKTDLHKFKVGESLSPECKYYLDWLDVKLSTEERIEFSESHSRWGEHTIRTSEFIYNPYGNSIAVNRNGLEDKLIKTAYSNGSITELQSIIKEIKFDNNRWKIIVETFNDRKMYTSKFLVIACGRNPFLKIDNTKRKYYDRLVAVTLIIDNETKEKRILYVESLPEGWIYSNQIPGNNTIVSFFTDSDLLPKAKFVEQFMSGKIPTINNPISTNYKIYTSDARTRWIANQSGLSWLRIGDAAYTIDPLSGKGILKNFEMIAFCVENIKDFIDNSNRIYTRYHEHNCKNFITFMQQRKLVFRREQRWFDYPFWKRRLS